MVDKVRVSDIAKELGIKSKEVVEKANEIGISVKAANSSVSQEDAEGLINFVLTGVAPVKKQEPKKVQPKVEKKAKTTSKTKKVEKKAPKQEPKKASKEEKKPAEKKVAKETKATPKVKEASLAQEKKVSKKQEDIEVEKAPKQEPKQEPKKEVKKEGAFRGLRTPGKETLAQASVKNRRGLVIVKKRKPVVSKTSSNFDSTDAKLSAKTIKKAIPSSLEAMFSGGDTEVKKKKKAKKAASGKKMVAQRLDLMGGNFSDDIYDGEDDMVVLPDLTLKPEAQAPKPALKKKQNNQPQYRHTNKGNMFQNQGGIGRRSRKRRRKTIDKDSLEVVKSIQIPEEIRVYEFAEKLGRQSSEVISKLFMLGVMTTKNDFLDKDSIEILAEEFDVEVTTINVQEEFDYVKAYEDEVEDSSKLKTRAPVVTIMGHVDHGKTSLLDYIRSSRVADGESGGITQHVGAYMVEKNDRHITFIDTPGHEAFTQMRARGAEVTDIVIVVVAADDGVKPQTREAIDHAKAAGVPMIIAVNKIDKPAANPDMVKTQLSEIEILPTDWGGEHEFVHVSAKSGEGIEDLLEIILLQADVLELQADPSRDAKATIIESSLEKGRGSVATVVVENGTLRVGDTIVAGVAYGKVRALLDDKGNNLKSIKPGEPGVIVGLSEVPDAGETVVKVGSDKEAKEYAKKRYEYNRQKELSRSTKVTLDELSERIAEGEIKSLPVIIKADVGGSLEAIKASLEKLKNEETKVNVISSGVGGISESDITLASASENCVILGFHVRPTGSVKEKAKSLGIEIKTYNIIYDLIDDVKGLLSGMMSPIIREESIGQAEVREVFVVPKIGAIAGCMVSDGSINRGAKVRLIRDGVIVYESSISSLKRFKDDVKEVAKGYECGIGIENFDDIKVGDYIESYKEVEEQVSL
ncbi:MAG: translation initiation factor IF-2 [Proteobacteria bacterium]|nr:MAG: translation initiation factor IF-2 [Pseudomonadota bacterium]